MFPMASASGSDIVCVELEDGIAPRDKAKARKHALALYDTQQANDGVELIVRINSLREQFGIEDVAAILATDTPPPALRGLARARHKQCFSFSICFSFSFVLSSFRI